MLPALFGELLAVAVALVDASGGLLEANAGFLRLIPPAEGPSAGRKVARFFVQPDFATLSASCARADGAGYRGLLTIGDCLGRTRTLVGRVSMDASGLRVLAEYDIVEIERINDTMLEINRDASVTRQSLTHANLALKQREVQIVEASLTDALTGVGNRRMLDQALAVEIARARRGNGALGAIMADIDHFKRVNDVHGHAAGDAVLARFGAILRSAIRPTDIVARFGGEEFVVLLPGASLRDAAAAAERIRAIVAGETIAPLPAPVTSSFGVAVLATGEEAAAFLGRADKALYRAKSGGRNRVEGGEAIAV